LGPALEAQLLPKRASIPRASMWEARELAVPAAEALAGGDGPERGLLDVAEPAPVPASRSACDRRAVTAAALACAASAAAFAMCSGAWWHGLLGPTDVAHTVQAVDVGQCPAETLPHRCIENGQDDADCCAMSGDGGCVDGQPAVRGRQCHANGAVTTCCPKPPPPCPGGYIQLGCLTSGGLDPDCCSPPADAECLQWSTGPGHNQNHSILPATPGRACSTDGAQKSTCCPKPSPTRKVPDSLFCFCVAGHSTGEADLTRGHYADKKSIFACDDWTVLSDGPIPPITTLFIGPLNSKWAYWHSWTNTGVFVRAWDAILNEGKWVSKAWTVKVDPDTVWFPERLRWHIKSLEVSFANNLYVRNTGQYFFGGIEVFSLAAIVQMFNRKKEVCTFKLEGTPEDVWIGWCLDALGAEQRQDNALLSNFMNGNTGACNNHWVVAFHPFKDINRWRACYDVAKR